MSSNPRRTPVTRPDSGADGLRLKTNLTLKKGATFHLPTTPPSSPPAFRVPSLPRRSQTNLDDVIDASRRRAAMTIGDVDSILTGSKSEASSRRSFRDNSLPVPQGFLDHMVGEPSAMDPETDRRVLRPRPRRSTRHQESDSGLGTSVASTDRPSKEAKTTATAITRSVTAIKTEEDLPHLSERAVNRIHEHTLKPLLAKASLKEFRPIILDCPRRIKENQIICLRDLEKTLIFMAPERAKSIDLYLDFCQTSIRCIQATVEYLSDREQTRPHDRPYNNGYFIDLVEQIRLHAEQLQAARERQEAGEKLDEMDVDPTDEVKLMGGLASTGRPAELVRVKKNGKAISIATGQPVEDMDEDSKSPIRFKRSMSEQLEDEEEIMRSMARRKKNASPAELAPKKCKEPGCNKEFKRPCDLTKHEKTHSRPWKCPNRTCKYHEYGWPTEKEMDRHVNDKHTTAPAMYECIYKPCPYKSKRESNCKQHMEKAHGWTYVRTKTNGKVTKTKSQADSVENPTPMIPGMPTPSSVGGNLIMTPPEEIFNYQDMFPTYPSREEFDASVFDNMDDMTFDSSDMQLDLSLGLSPIDNDTPSTDAGQYSSYSEMSPDINNQFDDIYGAHARLPTPTHSVYNKGIPEVFTNFTTAEMCPPLVAPAAPQISPGGQGNTMLFTPASMVDEGFDDFGANDHLGNDFVLFSSTKTTDLDNSLFMTPSAAGGFTQPSSQDFNIDYNNPSMDWAGDFGVYQNQP